MKKIMLTLLTIISIVIFIIFGCSKSESPTSPAKPTATSTPTVTPVSTSTPAANPNISGSLYLPAPAMGKQFVVIVDSDTNTSNGFVQALYGVCTDTSTTINYGIAVPLGAYYVYAYVDVDNSGLTGPEGLDYFGIYSNQIMLPPNNNSVNITLTQLPITVTLNVTLPGSAPGKKGFFAIFANNDYNTLSGKPVAGTEIICPSGTSFQVTFTVKPDDTGTYYLIGMVDADGSCSDKGCFPQSGDYLKIYGGSGVNWPASPNVTINNDITLNLALTNVTSNVFGTAYLPTPVINKEYTIFLSTVPLYKANSNAAVITKTAKASGSAINYDIFIPIPGKHYITFIMDVDNSGWDNFDGPVSAGDYAGIYGVPPPIISWYPPPYPATPNADLPGSGFNIYCDTYPGFEPPPTPIPTPKPTPGGSTGNININLTIPADQIGKKVGVIIDMDLNPNNGNTVAEATATVTGTSQQFNLTNIPVGTYYIYAGTTSGDNPPVTGDAVGIYGAPFPNFPSSPNAVVTNGKTFDITMVVATNNVSGRVYMPYSCPIGRQWAVVIDTDLDGGNGFLGITAGAINTGNKYFDYSMFLSLPGKYYIYAVVDYTGNGFNNGPDCGDFMGYYNYPQPIEMTPANNYTNMNINTDDQLLCNP